MPDIEPIDVYQKPVPGTRTKERETKWQAECTIEGFHYVEVSRVGASHELARTLVNEGYGDREMRIYGEGRPGYLAVPSFHRWAEWTYKGGKRMKYAKAQADFAYLQGLKEAADG